MGELSDRDLARVLDRAGVGGTFDPARKSQIRAEVLREFDRSVVATEVADESELVLTLASTSEPPTGRGTMALVAAAAIIGIVVGGLVIVGNRDSDVQPVVDRPPAPPTSIVARTTTTAPTDPTLPEIDGLTIGDPIPPGRYETTVAGGLSFDVPDGVVLVAVEPDRLTIGLPDRDASVSVVPIESSALDAAIERAEADGLLRVERSVGGVGNRTIERRDLTLTAQAIARFDCVAGEPCTGLDTVAPGLSPLALRSGSENFTTVLEVDDSIGIAIVEQFAAFGSPTSAITNSIIETIERTDGG